MADYLLTDGLLNELKEKFPGLEIQGGGSTVLLPVEDLIPFMKEVRENPGYAMDYLTNLTAAEYDDRFELIYNLVSLAHGYTLMVRVPLRSKDNPSAPSLCHLWQGANWQEREAYDLMGIVFTGYPYHPIRIFLEEGFTGHPLRKGFRWEGGREA